MRGWIIGMTAAALMASPADASKRPCRDAQGRIVPCPKPSPVPQHRCKDAAGRFVACDHPPGERRGS